MIIPRLNREDGGGAKIHSVRLHLSKNKNDLDTVVPKSFREFSLSQAA